MKQNEFQKIGLYDHNAASYLKIKSAFSNGEDIVGIVHATGTGKSYNALQLAYDNKDKKIIYVVPSNAIIEHIKKIIENNPNLDLNTDFSNLEFRTYQSFAFLSKEEIEKIKCDLLIIDEFHHLGAPIWGPKIDTMIETHPNMKIFGMTAYTVRDRGTSYERDMANPDTDELFSNKIQSRYDLCDAMIDGVLPKPIYKSAYINLINMENKLEEKVQKLDKTSSAYQEYMSILSDVKRKIHEAPSIPNLLRKNIKPNGKYIYFCPPCSEDGTNDIETIKNQAIEWLKEFISEEDIVIYTTTSAMGETGKQNRDAFYNDTTLDGKKVDNKLRIMFAINQYNEGIHAPNVDGVIMGRGTTSDIVYFEQLGRALAVRGNTKDKFDELEKKSIEELKEMCKDKEISFKENISKEDLIEKLVAPIVIDLTNNYDFIKELENNLKDRIKEIQKSESKTHRDIKIKDFSFDIELENQDLFEMLRYVMDRLTMTWEDYYNLAKAYYEHHKNLEIPLRFKTINGYEFDENGVKLGSWIGTQRKRFLKARNPLTEVQMNLLKEIGMIFTDVHSERWLRNYNLAKAYYEHYGNLEVPQRFKTTNGYDFDENGAALGVWILTQRQKFSGSKVAGKPLTERQMNLLKEIGMIFTDVHSERWMKYYNLAKAYYEHYGNLEILVRFKTINGYEFDENGVKLGSWIMEQRQRFSDNKAAGKPLTEVQMNLLKEIGMIFENVHLDKWMQCYNLAKAYYEHYGNLEIPKSYKTINGYDFDENGVKLGSWISNQRKRFSATRNPLTERQTNLLKEIGMIFKDVNFKRWMRNYNLAKSYYEHYGNLEIPVSFKTMNGYDFDENGAALGVWIITQRQRFSGKANPSLTETQMNLLKEIGMIFQDVHLERWIHHYNLAKAYYEHYGHLQIPVSFKTINGYDFDENGFKLGLWIATLRRDMVTKKEHLSSEKIIALTNIGMVWSIKKNREEIDNICNQYNINTNQNKSVINHISIQELQSKIEFLNAHNIPIVDGNGLLIDIFSMSSPNMKEKYGISLEELMNEYYIKNQKNKGV